MEKKYTIMRQDIKYLKWPICNVGGDVVDYITISRPGLFPLAKGTNDVSWVGYDESKLLLGVIYKENELEIHWYHSINSTVAESVMNSGYMSVLKEYADLIESVEGYIEEK